MTDDPRPGFNALRDKMLWHLKVHANAKPENNAEGLTNMAFEALGCPGGTAVAEEDAARSSFESAMRLRGLDRAPNGEYRNTFLQEEWEVWLEAWQARPALAAPKAEAPALLAKKHEGMRVDYSGLLGQCQRALRGRGEGANAEMLRQLQGHLKELGQRWYAGDTAVVDEILQLYCIEREARASLSVPPAHQGATHHE